MNGYHPSHELEWRDSSHYDYVCVKCNVADTTGGPGRLAEPCSAVEHAPPKDVFEKLQYAMISSCTCLTKTPDIYYHKETCRYRLLSEVYTEVERIFHYNGQLCSCIVQNGITPPGWIKINDTGTNKT